jgi:UDP-GlcNAc:undecaprenyl-phosphate/decaprenyl-phosphate GlcNAc-1-phosphate transferase
MNAALLLIIGFVTAVAFAMAIIPLVVRFAGLYQLYDTPDLRAPAEASRKVHVRPIPRLGGVAIVLSFFLTQIIWVQSSPLPGIFFGGFAVFLLGLADDIVSIRPFVRFFLQCSIACFAVLYHDLIPASLNIGAGVDIVVPPYIALPFSVFVIVGAVNTINMVDGLDGLAGGLALIGVTLLSFLYFLNSHDLGLLLIISCPMLGAIIGFLRYNTHPAVIFMGDGGSNWLGFMIGSIMLILITGKHVNLAAGVVESAQALPVLSVVMCLAIPVFDTALVMAGRIRRGTNPMKADKTHLHHALLKIGLSHSQAVSALYFMELLVGVVGILPVAYPEYKLDLAPFIGVAIVFGFVLIASKINTERTVGLLAQRAKMRETPEYGSLTKFLRYWENLNRYLIYSILLAGPAFAGAVRKDIGFAALAVAVLIVVSIILNASRQRDDFLDSACVALAATVLLVANNSNTMMIEWQGERVSIHPMYNSLFGALLVSTLLLFLSTAKKRYFIFKPSDFLFATVPLVLLLVPEPYRTEYRINIISLRAIVVFAAVRVLAKRKGYVMAHVKGVTLIALLFVFLAGVYGLRMVY